MALASGRSPRLSVRGLFQATTYSIMVLAALALFGTAGVPAPAAAQVKAPAKSKYCTVYDVVSQSLEPCP